MRIQEKAAWNRSCFGDKTVVGDHRFYDYPDKKTEIINFIELVNNGTHVKSAAVERAKAVEVKVRKLKLTKTADTVANSVKETLIYMVFPAEHWARLRINNVHLVSQLQVI